MRQTLFVILVAVTLAGTAHAAAHTGFGVRCEEAESKHGREDDLALDFHIDEWRWLNCPTNTKCSGKNNQKDATPAGMRRCQR